MPSPISAYDLITTAMRNMGVLAVGETPTSDEANDALNKLNDVIETWNIEGLTLVGGLPASFTTIAGTNTYTMGVGGMFNGQRPATAISSAYCTINGTDFPIAPWTLEEWMNQPNKTQQQQIIARFVYVNSNPLGQLILWPTPSAAIPVVVNYDFQLVSVPTLATTLTLPPGYARALQYALCVDLQSSYGGQDMSAYAKSTKAVIMAANRVPRVSRFDPSLRGTGRLIGGFDY